MAGDFNVVKFVAFDIAHTLTGEDIGVFFAQVKRRGLLVVRFIFIARFIARFPAGGDSRGFWRVGFEVGSFFDGFRCAGLISARPQAELGLFGFAVANRCRVRN